MNIEGNKVLWNYKNYYITYEYGRYIIYKNVTTRNNDGTAFSYYDKIDDSCNSIEEAIKLAHINR